MCYMAVTRHTIHTARVVMCSLQAWATGRFTYTSCRSASTSAHLAGTVPCTTSRRAGARAAGGRAGLRACIRAVGLGTDLGTWAAGCEVWAGAARCRACQVLDANCAKLCKVLRCLQIHMQAPVLDQHVFRYYQSFAPTIDVLKDVQVLGQILVLHFDVKLAEASRLVVQLRLKHRHPVPAVCHCTQDQQQCWLAVGLGHKQSMRQRCSGVLLADKLDAPSSQVAQKQDQS
jgi:hypothetical protein